MLLIENRKRAEPNDPIPSTRFHLTFFVARRQQTDKDGTKAAFCSIYWRTKRTYLDGDAFSEGKTSLLRANVTK